MKNAGTLARTPANVESLLGSMQSDTSRMIHFRHRRIDVVMHCTHNSTAGLTTIRATGRERELQSLLSWFRKHYFVLFGEVEGCNGYWELADDPAQCL